MMIIKIKLFASAKEIVGGKSEISLEFTEGATITVTGLRERLLQNYPKLAQVPFVFAINYKIVPVFEANTPYPSVFAITPFDEIALLPPISGG
jgi:molybdopterin converting factor small subunit